MGVGLKGAEVARNFRPVRIHRGFKLEDIPAVRCYTSHPYRKHTLV